MAQQAEQHVEHDHRPRIADMGEVVDGRSAHVHAYVRGIDRHERPLLAGQGVVELEFHRLPVDERMRDRRLRWPGVCSSGARKDGHSQLTLTDNLPAKATYRKTAVAGGAQWA